MNREMARQKRIHSQGYLNMTARFNPRTVKGRRAHPPKVEKIWEIKINKKERLKALKSALSATLAKELVAARGHLIEDVKHVPIVVDDAFQKMSETAKVVSLLEKFGLSKEIERCKERKVRAGRGKMRGRRHRVKKGPIVVVSKDEGICKAVKNIQGFDVALAKELSVGMLAPGTQPGRMAIYTVSAVKELGFNEKANR